MKTVGEILSTLFDKQFVEKAQEYSKFFDSWTDIAEKNGISSAAAHSRIKELDKGIVQIEIDHPGWKQILQTKQSKLLNDFRIRFPELDISGISLLLGQKEQSKTESEETQPEKIPVAEIPLQTNEPIVKGLNTIKDEDFKQKLLSLGQNIAACEKN